MTSAPSSALTNTFLVLGSGYHDQQIRASSSEGLVDWTFGKLELLERLANLRLWVWTGELDRVAHNRVDGCIDRSQHVRLRALGAKIVVDSLLV